MPKESGFEKVEPKEEEKAKSKIIFSFFRHGKKEEAKPGQSDYEVLLTKEGRIQAYQKGEEIKPQKEVAIAIGSPRKRAQETVARILFAEDFPPEMSFEEIKEKVQNELDEQYKLGPRRVRKIIADPRLNFVTYEECSKAVKEKRILPFLVYESDNLILEKYRDERLVCLTSYAGNVAEIIKKYLAVGSTFERIVQKDPEKYAQYGNQLERYLGTHLAVGESFLAKVVEKAKGRNALKEWVTKNPSGFKETEGFTVEIIPGKILIRYQLEEGKEETIEMKPEILDEIIKEKEELNRRIEESKK